MAVGTMEYNLTPDQLRNVLRNKPEKRDLILQTSRKFLEEGTLSGVTAEDLDAIDAEFNPPPPPVVPPPTLGEKVTGLFPESVTEAFKTPVEMPALPPAPELPPGMAEDVKGLVPAAPPSPKTILGAAAEGLKRLAPPPRNRITVPTTRQQQAANEAAMEWERGPIAQPVEPPVISTEPPVQPPTEEPQGFFGRALERITQGQREALIGQQDVARPVLETLLGPDPFVGPKAIPPEREPELRAGEAPAFPPVLPRIREALSPTGLTATPEEAQQQAAAEASLEITARERGETPYDFVKRTTQGREDFLERILSPEQIKAGAMGTTASMLGAVPWLEGLVGIDTPAGRISQEAVDVLHNRLRRYRIGDPGFLDAIPAGLGSMALFMVPGMGVANAVARLRGAGALANWVGAGTMGLLEAGGEAGDTYQTMRASGKGEQAAVKAANDVFAKNMILIPITEKLGFFGETGSMIRRALMGASMEGVQEFAQYVIQQRAQGQPFDLNQALTAAGVGAVVGGVAGPVVGMATQPPGQAPATVTGEAIPGQPTGIQPPTMTLGEPPVTPPPAELPPTDIPPGNIPPTDIPEGIPPALPQEPPATPPKNRYVVTSDDGRVGTILVTRSGQASFFEVKNPRFRQRYIDLTPDVQLPAEGFDQVFPASGMAPEDLQTNRFRFLTEQKIPAQTLARIRPTTAPPPTMAEVPAAPAPLAGLVPELPPELPVPVPVEPQAPIPETMPPVIPEEPAVVPEPPAPEPTVAAEPTPGPGYQVNEPVVFQPPTGTPITGRIGSVLGDIMRVDLDSPTATGDTSVMVFQNDSALMRQTEPPVAEPVVAVPQELPHQEPVPVPEPIAEPVQLAVTEEPVSPPDDRREQWTAKAIQKFGVTSNPEDALFLFPDGRFLDKTQGPRIYNHDDVSAVTGTTAPTADERNEEFSRNTGAVRVLDHGTGMLSIQAFGPLTPEQMAAIMRATRQYQVINIDVLGNAQQFDIPVQRTALRDFLSRTAAAPPAIAEAPAAITEPQPGPGVMPEPTPETTVPEPAPEPTPVEVAATPEEAAPAPVEPEPALTPTPAPAVEPAATPEPTGNPLLDTVLPEVSNSLDTALTGIADVLGLTTQEGQADVIPEPIATATPSGETEDPSYQLASWVRDQLSMQRTITWQELFAAADQFFGGTQAEGSYTPKDAYDALEMGVNLFVLHEPTGNLAITLSDIQSLRATMQLLPTQSKRTLEQEAYQQFSTPPHEAYTVAWAGNVQPGEQVVEPSAGTGSLAVFARNAGAEVIVNELDPRRADLLRQMGFDRVFTEDAEQFHNILPPDVQPTLILMNPPFSTAAGRMGNRRDPMSVTRHLEQALKRLQPSGRLVALVGRGMSEGMPTFMPWWQRIKNEYDVRANIGLPGSEYQKYGTTFDHQLVIIDKRGPTPPGGTVTGNVSTLEDALPLVEDIRNDRVSVAPRPGEPATGEPAREETPPQGRPATGPVTGGAPTTPRVGRGGRRGATQRPAPVPTGQPGGAAGGTPPGSPGLPVEAGPTGGPGEREGSLAGTGPGTPGGVPGADIIPETPTGEPTITIGQQTEQAAAGPTEDMTSAVYESYSPQKLSIPGAQPHPGKLVQSAAMATVDPPDPTYTPALPQTITGKLSIAQLEAVTYAGQVHEQLLPDETRKGFYIGDGTGVGKGREISGIILDNFGHGRRKAVWVSVNSKLFRDAQRDFGDTGGDIKKLFELSKVNASAEVKAKDGVLYTTYGTLKSAAKQTRDAAGNLIPGKKRLDQLVEWLGDDFDGALVFDEAHMMANSLDQRGARGVQSAAQQAMAGLELQRRLPKARVVYVSATGATEVRNLAYAARLGLWGRGTPFPDVQTFVSNIQAGGLAAMELVARDLKARGLYLARSLSFEDVTYETLEHPLTPEQSEIYNTLAESWQIVLRNVNQALKDSLGVHNGRAKSAAMSAFWSAHQRFFNQIITSMQMPSAVARIRQDIDRGEAAVLQLVNTNEAIQERRLAAMEEDLSSEALEGLDLTPRENLMQYLQNSFPTQQYEEYVDDQGNTSYRPVYDAKGNPVENADAVAAREALLDRLGAIRVPEGPLEIILNQFGPDLVAEVTGRSRRVVRVRDADGERTEVQRRGEAAALTDARAFMQDKKRILVFSDAGGTGQSYHAALTSANQRHRQHYLIQPGWRADRAVQGMGRTHRTNEASAPNYVLVTTDLKGQKRFLSSVARRLDQLGALTKGQRQTGSQGLFSARDNLESQYAQDAMQQFWRELYRGRVEGLDFAEITDAMGLDLIDRQSGSLKTELPQVTQFLNRILSLDIDRMNQVFDAFFERVEQQVASAMAAGTLDVGVETIQALRTEMISEQTVYVDPDSGAETKYVHLQLTHPQKFTQFHDIGFISPDFKGFYINQKSGRVSGVSTAGTRTDASGSITDRYWSRSPTSSIILDDLTALVPLSFDEAQRLWEETIAKTPKTYTEELHLLTGALLPIWDRVPGHTRVVRVQTADGRRLLGRYIAPKDLPTTLNNLGANASAPQITPKDAIAKILDERYTIRLANGWRMKQSRVSGEPRIELVGPEYADLRILTDEGVFTERIQWETRYFLPTGPNAEQVFGTVTRYRPIVAVEPPVRTAADVLATQRQAAAGGTPAASGMDIPREPTPEVRPETPEASPEAQDFTMLPPSERRPLTAGTAEVAPKLSDIMKDLETSLNLPIRLGRLRRATKRLRVGQYTPHTRIVRIRASNDVEVASHEIGHYLEDSLDLDALTSRFERELTYLSPPGYRPDEERHEGFAEFVRLYITQEAQARAAVPAAFYDLFEEAIREQAPVWHAAMLRARDAFTQFSEASPSARIGAVLSAEAPKRLSKGIRHWWHEFYRAVLEDMHWVKVARDLMAQGQALDPTDDAYLLGRLIRGVNGKIGNMVRHGMVQYGDLSTRVSEGLPAILDPWAEDLAKGSQSELRRYLIARGGLEAIALAEDKATQLSRKTGKPATIRPAVPFSRDDAMATIAAIEAEHPDVRKTFAALRRFEDAGLTYLRDAGMLSDEAFSTIRAMHRNHVPLYRVIEESTPLEVSAFLGARHIGSGSGGSKFADISSPVRRRHGSTRDIIDPLESMIKNTYAFISAADRNDVMQALVRQAEGITGFGGLIEPLPTPTTPTTAEVAQIRDDLEAAGITIPDGAEDAMVSIWRPNYHPQRPNAVWVWTDGTRHLYQLAPELYRSVEALDQETVQQWVRFASAPAHLLRLGATQINPSFMIRNPVRDIQSGWVNAGWAVPKGFVSMMQAALSPERGERLQKLYNAWELSGGANAAMVSMDRASLQEDLASFLRRGHLKQQTIYALKHPISALRHLSEMSELLTRLDVFAGSLGPGGLDSATKDDLLRAGFASREGSLDFGRHGAMLAALRHMTAFMNANIQGIDKMGRVLFTEGTAQDRAMAWLRVFAGVTLPSMLMWAVNADDDRYRRLPQWLKDTAWLIPVGSYFIPIPKPPLVGQFFGSSMERFLDWVFAKDPQAGKAMGRAIMRGLDFAWLPTAAAPIMENWANRSLFFDRPIVPRGLEGVLPVEQATMNTSETARQAAKLFGPVKDVPMVGQLSAPAKLENLVHGYAGGVGRIGLQVGDAMLQQLGLSQVKVRPTPTVPLGDVPVLSSITRTVMVPTSPTMQSPQIEQFYEALETARRYETTIRFLIREGRVDDARSYLQDPSSTTVQLSTLERAEKMLHDYRARLHQVYRSTTMTRDAKRQEIDEIAGAMNDLAGRALQYTQGQTGSRPPYKRMPRGLPPAM